MFTIRTSKHLIVCKVQNFLAALQLPFEYNLLLKVFGDQSKPGSTIFSVFVALLTIVAFPRWAANHSPGVKESQATC